eukprot:4515022-Pyramimonas_sp.AAC.1
MDYPSTRQHNAPIVHNGETSLVGEPIGTRGTVTNAFESARGPRGSGRGRRPRRRPGSRHEDVAAYPAR